MCVSVSIITCVCVWLCEITLTVEPHLRNDNDASLQYGQRGDKWWWCQAAICEWTSCLLGQTLSFLHTHMHTCLYDTCSYSNSKLLLPFLQNDKWIYVSLQLVSTDTCQSDFSGSDLVSAMPSSVTLPPIERMGGLGDSRPPSFQWVRITWKYSTTV